MIEDCLGAPAASNEIAHFTRGQPSWQAISFGNCAGPDLLVFLSSCSGYLKAKKEGGIKEEE